MGAAGKPQHLVSQLFPVLEEEEDKNDDEKPGRNKFDRRREPFVLVAQPAILRNDAHFEIGSLGRFLRRFRNALQRTLDSGECSARRSAEESQFLLDVAARCGSSDLTRHKVKLLIDPPAPE